MGNLTEASKFADEYKEFLRLLLNDEADSLINTQLFNVRGELLHIFPEDQPQYFKSIGFPSMDAITRWLVTYDVDIVPALLVVADVVQREGSRCSLLTRNPILEFPFEKIEKAISEEPSFLPLPDDNLLIDKLVHFYRRRYKIPEQTKNPR